MDAGASGVGEADLQQCAVALLIRAAAARRAAAAMGSVADPDSPACTLAVAALGAVECRPVGRGRAAASVAASGAALAVAALLCVHFCSAFLAAPASQHTFTTVSTPAKAFAGPVPAVRCAGQAPSAATRFCRRGATGTTMISGGPVPVDPALAAALVHLGVSRALHDLERLGYGGARGGSSRVVVRAGRMVPDPRGSWQAEGRRRLRQLKSAARRPGEAMVAVAVATTKAAVKVGGGRGTATLIRETAYEAVRPFLNKLPFSFSLPPSLIV